MRNWIIGAAALLAVAAPSVAAAQTGYVGVFDGSADAGGAADESTSMALKALSPSRGSGSIVFEIDAAYTDSDDADDAATALIGHVYGRNDDHLFGGFVGIAGCDDSETWIAGLEANKYFANWTLAGAVFYGNNDDAELTATASTSKRAHS